MKFFLLHNFHRSLFHRLSVNNFRRKKIDSWIKIYTNRNSRLRVFLNSGADDFEYKTFFFTLLYSINSVCQIVQRSWYRQTEGCSEFKLKNISYLIHISLHNTIISLEINIDFPFAFVLKPILYQLSYLKYKNCFWTIVLRLLMWCCIWFCSTYVYKTYFEHNYLMLIFLSKIL